MHEILQLHLAGVVVVVVGAFVFGALSLSQFLSLLKISIQPNRLCAFVDIVQ